MGNRFEKQKDEPTKEARTDTPRLVEQEHVSSPDILLISAHSKAHEVGGAIFSGERSVESDLRSVTDGSEQRRSPEGEPTTVVEQHSSPPEGEPTTVVEQHSSPAHDDIPEALVESPSFSIESLLTEAGLLDQLVIDKQEKPGRTAFNRILKFLYYSGVKACESINAIPGALISLSPGVFTTYPTYLESAKNTPSTVLNYITLITDYAKR